MLMSVETPTCSCLMPKSYLHQDSYDQAMEQFENELIEETMRPFVNSGHAFVCFDSVTSLNLILKHFRTTPMQNIKIFFVSIKDRFINIWRWFTGQDSATHH